MKPCILADNRLADGLLTASSTALGFDVLNILDRRPYTFWQAASTAAQTVTVDCGSAKPADAIGIMGHNLASAALTVQSSADGAAWTTRLTLTPADNGAAMVALAGTANPDTGRLTSPVSARYWRLQIPARTEAAFIGSLMIGQTLRFLRFPTGGFTPVADSLEAVETDSKSGHLLGVDVRYQVAKVTATFSYPGDTWTRVAFWDFYQANLRSPFFYAWDLAAWPREVLWARFDRTHTHAPKLDAMGRVDDLSLRLRGVRQ